MKNSLKLSDAPCNECGSRVSRGAESCPDCGYPQATLESDTPEAPALAETHQEDYRLLKFGGLVLLIAGVAAAYADARLASGITFITGGALFLSGLLGSWWNRRD